MSYEFKPDDRIKKVVVTYHNTESINDALVLHQDLTAVFFRFDLSLNMIAIYFA